MGPITRAKARNAIANCVTTDLDHDGLDSIARMFENAKGSVTIYGCVIPTSSKTIDGVTYAVLQKDSWTSLLAQVDAGLDPAQTSETSGGGSDAIAPSSYQVTIRNGSGVIGCAAQAADKLSAAGYVVIETGNANAFVYNETLVIYNDDADANVAADVVDKLGVGRTVQNPGSYTFDGDILVMVGGDWIP